MTILRVAGIALLGLLGASCAEQRIGTETLRTNLKTLHETTVTTDTHKSAAREALEALEEEYRAASDQDKPELMARLVEARANYLHATRDHMVTKRELEEARRIYLHDLLQNEQAVTNLEVKSIE